MLEEHNWKGSLESLGLIIMVIAVGSLKKMRVPLKISRNTEGLDQEP